jgi:hypothetical protein
MAYPRSNQAVGLVGWLDMLEQWKLLCLMLMLVLSMVIMTP